MSEKATPAACLTIESVEAYLEDSLSAEDRSALENHLDDCRLCHDAMEGIRRYGDLAQITRSLDSLKKRIEIRTAPEALARNT